MNKAEMLDRLDADNRRWEALLAEIGEARMTEPGVGGPWSMKDIIAHLTGWRKRSVARLQAAGPGEPEPPMPWPASLQTDDEINDWIYEQNRDRPLDAVLADSRQTYADQRAALQ